jgi:hypothetical protein
MDIDVEISTQNEDNQNKNIVNNERWDSLIKKFNAKKIEKIQCELQPLVLHLIDRYGFRNIYVYLLYTYMYIYTHTSKYIYTYMHIYVYVYMYLYMDKYL